MNNSPVRGLSQSVRLRFGPRTTISKMLEVGRTFTDVYVAPALVSLGADAVVGYYDESRQLVVARLEQETGRTVERIVLPETFEFDSHNDISLGFDRSGRLHVTGNMHASGLTYYRSSNASSPINSLVRVGVMVSSEIEKSVTYPRFFIGPQGDLWFCFRDGTSGNGVIEMFLWTGGEWTRPLRGPLLAADAMSPYIDQYRPVVGSDGRFHLTWVWRDSPDASTNHTLSHAVSSDLVTWYGTDGEKLSLPLCGAAGEIVDGVGAGHGILNNNCRLGTFDDGQPIIVYHKRLRSGELELFGATPCESGWRSAQLTRWGLQWDFEGRGTIDFAMELGTPRTGIGRVSLPVWVRGELVSVTVFQDLAREVRGIPRAGSAPQLGTRESVMPWWFIPDSLGTLTGLAWQAVPPARDMPPDRSVPPGKMWWVRAQRPRLD